ncbi:MAG: FAD-dependent oxidoreductase [Planctomycetota bacterium]
MADQVFPEVVHEADVCVVGGGMPGLAAALAAARHGAKTVLMHERPVLGGNASSECRVHVSGKGDDVIKIKETGILEEIRMENLGRNPNLNYAVWDTLLYEKARFQEGLTLLLNCSCQEAELEDGQIRAVRGWQLTTETHHRVTAKIFIDCSGDAVLAPLSNAPFRVGREARSEYDEAAAPETADNKKMGHTCLFAARTYDTPQPFTPPSWAQRFETADDLPYGGKQIGWLKSGYWWVEVGGQEEWDTIADTERIRDELLAIVYGVWDFVKNRSEIDAEHWALEWVGFLPAKRESRRYVGAHVLTQNDVEAEGRFDDIVAYGGWTMDDHNPLGFWSGRAGEPATIFHPAPSPYGIPFRSLYSAAVPNLMFSGRCASGTHMAMSSMRVMGTGVSMGQAAGTAAALAARDGKLPADLHARMDELQQTLLYDDCYIPWMPQRFGDATRNARYEVPSGDGELLRDGVHRPVGEDPHRIPLAPGESATMTLDAAASVHHLTVIVDSALDRNVELSHLNPNPRLTTPPPVLPKAYRIEAKQGDNWTVLHREDANLSRLIRVPVQGEAEALRFTLEATWEDEPSHLYAMYVD